MKSHAGKIINEPITAEREKLLREITTYLDMGQSVVLIAPKGYCKRSIIQKIIDENSKTRSVRIDFNNVFSKRDFAESLIKESYALLEIDSFNGNKSFTFDTIPTSLSSHNIAISDIDYSRTMDLLSKNDDDNLLRHALELPEKIAGIIDEDILFSIDELGNIRNLQEQEQILMLMRAAFQKTERVNFLFSGSQYFFMKEVFTNKKSPFFRFAEIFYLPSLEAEDREGFLRGVSRSFFENMLWK